MVCSAKRKRKLFFSSVRTKRRHSSGGRLRRRRQNGFSGFPSRRFDLVYPGDYRRNFDNQFRLRRRCSGSSRFCAVNLTDNLKKKEKHKLFYVSLFFRKMGKLGAETSKASGSLFADELFG